ncbi:sortase domain-containing protein [Adlercreutzia caecimuris]|uniref:sortase domain-containing protein n=1 Tax=Adlercreutzia caecimuris TaxID=671266 RepID=UPI001603F425|nr:sortase [Adlercreutzia caecimuris]MCI9208226.1 sortase [Adlercreutzia caecimuris]
MLCRARHRALSRPPRSYAFAALAFLVLAAGLVFPASALGAETATSELPPVTRGVGDFFLALEGRIDSHGQEVLAEKELEHARRSDEVSEKLRLDAMNSKGDEYSKSLDAASQLLDGTATVEELADEGGSTDLSDTGVDSTGEPAASDNTPAAAAEKKPSKSTSSKKRKNTIRFNGEYVSYVQGSPADETAPEATAAAWVSNGDVTDNENTYFIGHNPGVFSGVMNLDVGDKVTVWDGKGRSRTYYVFDVLTLPNQSNYFRYEGRIAPTGESITLQTCCADNKHVRCVMAR